MSLRHIISQDLIHCSPETTVREAATLMKDEDVGAIVVMRDETAVGIVTDRDLALRCLSEGQDPSACSVGDVMTRRIVTIRNDEGLADAVKAMRKAEVRRLIVVDESDRPVGLLSFGDLFGLLASELAALAAPASPREPKLGTTEKLGAAA